MSAVIAVIVGSGRAGAKVHGIAYAAESALCGLPESDVRSVLWDGAEAVEFGDWIDGLFERRWPTCEGCEAAALAEPCDRPEAGTIGAMSHCRHWHDADGEVVGCCWCGSTEDDAGSCPAAARPADGGAV